MPKTAQAAVPAVARAAGIELGLTEDTITRVFQDRNRAPGQSGVLAIYPHGDRVGLATGLAFATPGPDGEVVAEDELLAAFEVRTADGLMAVDTAVNASWVDLLLISMASDPRPLGAIEHLVRKYNLLAEKMDNGGPPRCELVEQPPAVEADAKAKLREYQIGRTSQGADTRALTAELHWWFAVFNRRGLLD